MDPLLNRLVSVVAAVASLSMLWAVFVVPGGPPWVGSVWLSAVAVLFVGTAALFVGVATSSLWTTASAVSPSVSEPLLRR